MKKRVPFTIHLRSEIEAGKYKVVTEHGEPVEIVKWDCKGQYPILAVIDDGNTHDSEFFFGNGEGTDDKLFLVKDMPNELTEFESRLAKILDYAMKHPVGSLSEITGQARKLTPEFLALAKTQLKKEFEAEYKRGYADCRIHDEERISKAHLEGFSEGVEHADKRNREAVAYPFPMHGSFVLPCYLGGPCTNPHHDCINCPRQGATDGPCTTGTNIDIK